ncbi:MAG: uroporphyrinogen decarboxylase family protein [Clostridia bacterium]|jgi:uroporphyrinogen decarboxylase|nr:hypothetical protein [Clostridiaceae bacterium]
MYELDIEQFWADDELAHKDNCFYKDAPQVALGIRMSDECVFAELDVPGDPWGDLDPLLRARYNKMYNDKAEKIVGRRLLSEKIPNPDAAFPYVKRIGEIFGGTYIRGEYTSEWLVSDIKTYDLLEKRLDYIDRMDLADFMLPPNWEAKKNRIYEKYGILPDPINAIRGPVTLACSIVGEENLIFMYYDARELFERFGKTIGDVIIGMIDVMNNERGAKAPVSRGFSFYDDNCVLLTPEMYEVFGYPILKRVFDYTAPGERDRRYQHSDSAMEHLLPVLARLNLTGCNFGPTVTVDKIRRYMPKTRIDGCLSPLTFMRNNPDEIIAEVKRDCEMIKEAGTKGLNLTTAGSINNGSSLESMRLVMQVIQNYGRY